MAVCRIANRRRRLSLPPRKNQLHFAQGPYPASTAVSNETCRGFFIREQFGLL